MQMLPEELIQPDTKLTFGMIVGYILDKRDSRILKHKHNLLKQNKMSLNISSDAQR